MKTYEVRKYVFGQEFTFKVVADTGLDALKVVDEKSASELLAQIKIGDLRGSSSSSLIEELQEQKE